MDKERVALMLALARKKREASLEDHEQAQLDAMRQEYLADFRAGFKQQLDQVYIQQEDGSFEKLPQKPPFPDKKGDA
ncbi:MAG: DUF896 domain-containing protein [Christensenellales bacterium]